MRFIIISLCVFAAAAAAAETSRKIDFSVAIIDQDGEPMLECTEPATLPAVDPACKTRRAITLGVVAMRAVMTPEPNLAPEESLKRGQLALSIYKSTGAELTAEEIALIKRQLAKSYGPLVVARTFPLLDPAVK